MQWRAGLATMVLAAGTVGAVAGELWWHRMRAPVHCGVPPYDYRSVSGTPPITGITGTALPVAARTTPATMFVPVGTPAVPLERVTPGGVAIPVAQRVKVYQLAEPDLTILHCSVVGVVVTLQEDGRWMINLTAVQNPDAVDPELYPQAIRFVRNRFYVQARPMGLFQLPEAPLGKPQFSVLTAKPFWVERGQVVNYHFSGIDPFVSQYFDAIDRIAIDFRFE